MKVGSQDTEGRATLMQYLGGCVAFDVPEDAVISILIDRDIPTDSFATDVCKSVRDLCKADLLRWICTSTTTNNGTTDKDNQWEHTDKGFSIDSQTRASLIRQANEIYSMYGEKVIGKNYIRISQHGIKRRNIQHIMP